MYTGALFAEQLPHSWAQQAQAAAVLHAPQQTHNMPGLQTAAAMAAAQQQQQQQQQQMQMQMQQYQHQHGGSGQFFQQQITTAHLPSLPGTGDTTHLDSFHGLNFHGRRPDLVINIPGTTAAEVPYNQRCKVRSRICVQAQTSCRCWRGCCTFLPCPRYIACV
jgi:hypothetical protein